MTRIEIASTVAVFLMTSFAVPHRIAELHEINQYKDQLAMRQLDDADFCAAMRKGIPQIAPPSGLEVTDCSGIQKGNEDIANSMLTYEQMREGDETAERR